MLAQQQQIEGLSALKESMALGGSTLESVPGEWPAASAKFAGKDRAPTDVLPSRDNSLSILDSYRALDEISAIPNGQGNRDTTELLRKIHGRRDELKLLLDEPNSNDHSPSNSNCQKPLDETGTESDDESSSVSSSLSILSEHELDPDGLRRFLYSSNGECEIPNIPDVEKLIGTAWSIPPDGWVSLPFTKHDLASCTHEELKERVRFLSACNEHLEKNLLNFRL